MISWLLLCWCFFFFVKNKLLIWFAMVSSKLSNKRFYPGESARWKLLIFHLHQSWMDWLEETENKFGWWTTKSHWFSEAWNEVTKSNEHTYTHQEIYFFFLIINQEIKKEIKFNPMVKLKIRSRSPNRMDTREYAWIYASMDINFITNQDLNHVVVISSISTID